LLKARLFKDSEDATGAVEVSRSLLTAITAPPS